MTKKNYVSLIRSVFALALTQATFANAFVKEFGMNDLGVAYPQSATCSRYNPANILDVGNQMNVAGGITYLNGHFSVSDSAVSSLNQSGSTSQCKWLPIGIFGMSKQLSENTAVAISSDAGITSAKGNVKGGVNFLGTAPFGNESLIAIIVPTFAFKMGCHNFGISLPVQFSRAKSEGFQNVIPNSLYPEDVTNKGYDWAEGFNLRLGWLYHMTPRIMVGVSYFSPMLATTRFHKYRGAIPLAGKFQAAQEVIAGATYKFDCATITFQASFVNFQYGKTFSNPVNSTAPSGSPNGPGAGFKNVYTIVVGGDYQLLDSLTVRAGCAYLPAPFIKKSNIIANFFHPNLFVRNSFAWGFTQKFSTWDFDFGMLYAIRRSVTSDSLPQLFGAKVNGSGSTLTTIAGLSIFY